MSVLGNWARVAGLALAMAQPLPALGTVVLEAHFSADAEGFVYRDDAFRGTAAPSYASGSFDPAGGAAGGGLRVDLGGVDSATVDGMSGGFAVAFTLTAPELLEVTLHYHLTQTADYESSEWSQVLVALDGALVGTGGADFVAEIKGDGNGGADRSTGWREFRVTLGAVAAGPHELVVGGYNNRKTFDNESTTIRLDDVIVATPAPVAANRSARQLVESLDRSRFEANIATLAAFGTRHWSQQGNLDAGDWLEAELASYGYAVERHAYSFSGQIRENVHATKIGSTFPDRMFLVSAHMDSTNTETGDRTFAPGADDDASGTSLVLEVARAFAPADVEVETSVRFVFWNNEETGLDGSEAYVADRRALQGVESPPGSGLYPEPTWLGILQHDMILFDHGLPPQPDQIPGADIDVEYQSGASFVGDAVDLAAAVHAANVRHASDHPVEVSADMNHTDSKSFQADCPALSLRENRRLAEIGNGANPHWHQTSDVVSTYSPDDFRLGFNVVQTTTGAIAELSGALIVGLCGNGVVDGDETCDDGNTASGDGCSDLCEDEPCANGIDDDGDGLVDVGQDPGCVDAADLSERDPTLPCDDGLDDDGDGDIDFPADPGCVAVDAFHETTACDDSVDNDGDGRTDWDGGGIGAPDPQCATPFGREAGACGLGFELALLLPLLARLRRR